MNYDRDFNVMLSGTYGLRSKLEIKLTINNNNYSFHDYVSERNYCMHLTKFNRYELEVWY